MKFRNKKTGEIGNLQPYGIDGRIWVWIDNMSKPEYRYSSLAELNEEWEDYKEPKKTWFIDTYGSVRDREAMTLVVGWGSKPIFEFETKEEAEQAVEKLKAWKRLKDTGFTIRQWEHTPDMNLTTGSFINIKGFIPEVVKNIKDLDLLFGGEE